MKRFARSAFTPSDEAPLLDDPNQDICNKEPILDMTSYRHSRNCEDKRQTAPSTQEVGGPVVVRCRCRWLKSAPNPCTAGANNLPGNQHSAIQGQIWTRRHNAIQEYVRINGWCRNLPSAPPDQPTCWKSALPQDHEVTSDPGVLEHVDVHIFPNTVVGESDRSTTLRCVQQAPAGTIATASTGAAVPKHSKKRLTERKSQARQTTTCPTPLLHCSPQLLTTYFTSSPGVQCITSMRCVCVCEIIKPFNAGDRVPLVGVGSPCIPLR